MTYPKRQKARHLVCTMRVLLFKGCQYKQLRKVMKPLYQKSDLKMSSNGVAVRGKKSSW